MMKCPITPGVKAIEFPGRIKQHGSDYSRKALRLKQQGAKGPKSGHLEKEEMAI